MPVVTTIRSVQQLRQAWEEVQASRRSNTLFLSKRASEARAESRRQRSIGSTLRLEARALRRQLGETRQAALGLLARPDACVLDARPSVAPVPIPARAGSPPAVVEPVALAPGHAVTRDSHAQSLWAAYAAQPSASLREQLIEQNRPLALAILKRLGYGGDEDLQQVALIGLVHAVDRYDPTQGNQFATFATPTIVGEVKRYLRDFSRTIRPPRSIHDLHTALLGKVPALTSELGRSPTLAELARALGTEPEQIVEAMAMEDVSHPVSFDSLRSSTESEDVPALHESLGAVDPEYARVEERLAWANVLDALEAPLRRVIQLRFLQDMTQREAAARLGVSQMQVSRLERRALARAREIIRRSPGEL